MHTFANKQANESKNCNAMSSRVEDVVSPTQAAHQTSVELVSERNVSTLEEDSRGEVGNDKRQKAADAAVKRALDEQARGVGDIAKCSAHGTAFRVMERIE